MRASSAAKNVLNSGALSGPRCSGFFSHETAKGASGVALCALADWAKTSASHGFRTVPKTSFPSTSVHAENARVIVAQIVN